MDIKVSEKDKKILEKYSIDVKKYDDLEDLLFEIDDVMTSYVDEYDEPLPEFLELEKVYDAILYENNSQFGNIAV